MSDDQHFSTPSTAPDWERVARAMAGRGWHSAPRLADSGAPAGQPAALVDALAATLRPPIPAAPSPADTERALEAVLARRGELAPPRTARWRPAALGTAAAAAALLLVAGGYRWREIAGRQRAESAARHASFAPALATRANEVDSLRLPDGSVVALGPSTAVDTAVGFGGGRREIVLRGAALLDVTHDAAHPFVVHTTIGVVRDVGTSFVVRSEAPGGLVVAVRSGAVAVRRGADAPSSEQRLAAGDRAVVPMQGAVRIERGAGADADLAVARGRMVLDAAPVAEVVESMRRWYGIDLRVEGAALAGRRVSATFRNESGADAARIVAAAMGAAARIVGDTAFITAAVVPVL